MKVCHEKETEKYELETPVTEKTIIMCSDGRSLWLEEGDYVYRDRKGVLRYSEARDD